MATDLSIYKWQCVEFCDAAGIPLYPWQKREIAKLTAFDREGHPLYNVAGVSTPRSNGKTWLAAAIGIWRFAVAAPGNTLAASLGKDQAARMLQYCKAFVNGSSDLQRLIVVRREHLELRGTDHRFEIISREKIAARSPHFRTILFDEAGWSADSDQFEVLLAGQGSEVDPLMLLTSTVGKRSGPLTTVQQLAEKGTAGIYWSHSSKNESPAVTKRYLARQKKLLPPVVYSREHANTLRDGEDSFATEAEIDAAFAGHGRADRDARRYIGLDLATSGIASAVVCSKRASDGLIFAEEVRVWKGSRKKPINLPAIQEWIAGLSKRYINVEWIGIESWQGAMAVQSLEGQGHPVVIIHQTAALKSEMYGSLQRAFIEGLISLPRSKQLADELAGATVEASATGLKVDGVPHPDVLVSLGIAALAAVEGRDGPDSMQPSFPNKKMYDAMVAEQKEGVYV